MKTLVMKITKQARKDMEMDLKAHVARLKELQDPNFKPEYSALGKAQIPFLITTYKKIIKELRAELKVL